MGGNSRNLTGVQSSIRRNDEVIRMCHLISNIKLKQEILLALDVLSESPHIKVFDGFDSACALFEYHELERCFNNCSMPAATIMTGESARVPMD
jgi:hypothetical protein